MAEPAAASTQLVRQVAHWSSAASRLRRLDDVASAEAWRGLESYLGIAVRKALERSTERLQREASLLRATLGAARTPAQLAATRRRLVVFRRQYLRTEATLDFYADAINTRTNPTIAALLRACDTLAHRSMTQVLDPLDRQTPVVLTYLDKGLGASILKAGLRLWDGSTESPAATIKVVRHNLHRPTSLIHEAGHQVAHILGWNGELAAALERGLRGAPRSLARVWASWASEIAADAFAFAHTGYGAVASLHDVLAGDEAFVFRFVHDDPHPTTWLRVLLNVEMCRRSFGAGPWDELAEAWTADHDPGRASSETRSLLELSRGHLAEVVELALYTPMRAFQGRSLARLVNPDRVSPKALGELATRLGPALYTSMHWVWTEALRLLALSSLEAATRPERADEVLAEQASWMLRLGGAARAA